MPLTEANRIPRCTYRVQLHAKFTFDHLRAVIPYFQALGISDLYLSPIFTAAPGSLHGYDVSDYGQINPELGGEVGFDQLAVAAKNHGMGLLVDFVPNHMGIQGPGNRWWRDVLEHGCHSAYAGFFDIDWKTSGKDLRVMAPILNDHYGQVLEEGGISLRYDGEFALAIGETLLPVSPDSYPLVLEPLSASVGPMGAALGELVHKFSQLPQQGGERDLARAQTRATQIGDLKQRLAALLQSSELRPALDERLRRINGTAGQPESFATLDALIERQHYRLTRWKAAAHEINYRRFFAISSLVGLRMEKGAVFQESHALLGELMHAGKISGIRIDHIDGLRLPGEYLQRVQAMRRPEMSRPFYVLVEKILKPGEKLPGAWPVHGTTGYEFPAELAGLFVDQPNENEFTETYRRFTGDHETYADAVCRSNRMITAEMFATAVNNLGVTLAEIVSFDRRWQDLTRSELTQAVREMMANFPVYRIYREGEAAASVYDRGIVDEARLLAVQRNPLMDPEPVAFLSDLLTGDYPPRAVPAEYRQRLVDWVLTFQQYTGAVRAKSVEDTTFYTHCRFIALNEVGGDPAAFGGTLVGFHTANRDRLRESPHTLLATSTHDTKLGEDVRARLYALSELPGEWARWLDEWHAINKCHTTLVDGRAAPDALDEYRFYQILLGAWPLEPHRVDDTFRSRLRDHFRKAVSEAKRHTAVLHPNERYFSACDRFVDALTTAQSAQPFWTSFHPFAAKIARAGMVNALSQVVLKCTVPGVPDFYQGSERWNLSLVDPDNRRPVDFRDLAQALSDQGTKSPAELLLNWRDGGIKLRLMQTLLRRRAAQPALFEQGTYSPISASGSFADRVVAFVRRHAASALLVVTPRLVVGLGSPPLGQVWDDTRLEPTGVSQTWRDVLTDAVLPDGDMSLRTLFAELPFAVLASERVFDPPSTA